MAKKARRSSRKPPRRNRSPAIPEPQRQSVTPERAARLYRLLQILRRGPQTRSALMRRLKLDMRGFYRDLDALRKAGIVILLDGRRYYLATPAEIAIPQLPFPDPHLTLGEAMILAKGRTKAHRLLKQQVSQIVSG